MMLAIRNYLDEMEYGKYSLAANVFIATVKLITYGILPLRNQ